MEGIKRNSFPDVDCGMAYLAHPYAPLDRKMGIFEKEIKKANAEETGDIAYEFMQNYPNMTIISPLHNYSFLEGKQLRNTKILEYDFKLLSKCTHLILSGHWRNSKGCMAEYGYAKARGIRIYEYRDGLLYPLE